MGATDLVVSRCLDDHEEVLGALETPGQNLTHDIYRKTSHTTAPVWESNHTPNTHTHTPTHTHFLPSLTLPLPPQVWLAFRTQSPHSSSYILHVPSRSSVIASYTYVQWPSKTGCSLSHRGEFSHCITKIKITFHSEDSSVGG